MNLASASVLTVCTLINHSSTGKSLGCSGITLALSTNQAPILAIPTIQILYLTSVYFFPEILGKTDQWEMWISSQAPIRREHQYTITHQYKHQYTITRAPNKWAIKESVGAAGWKCSRAEWPVLTSCPPGIRCRLRTFTGADAPDAFFNVRPETSRPRHPMQFKNSTFSINWIPHPGAFFVVPQEIQPQLKSIIRSGPSSSIFCQEMKIWHFIVENLDLIISYCSPNCAHFLHEYIQ